MAFTGRIDWNFGTQGFTTRSPHNGFLFKGEDNEYYCVNARITSESTSDSVLILALAHIETNTIVDSVNLAEIKAACSTLTSGATGTFRVMSMLPIIGTQYVGVVCGGSVFDENETFITCPIYKINSSGLLELVGGFAYNGANYDLYTGGSTGQLHSSVAVGSEIYFLILVRTDSGLKDVMVHAPYTGTNVDLTAGSFDARLIEAPFDTAFMVPVNGSKNYTHRCGLIDRGGSVIGMLKYIDWDHLISNNFGGGTPSPIISPLTDPQMFYCEFDFNSETATPLSNISSQFGAPFSDALRNFNDVFTGNDIADDYVNPCIIGDEVFLIRNFSDDINRIRVRRWDFPDSSTVTSLGVSDNDGFTITAYAGGASGGSAFRDGIDDTVQYMMRDNRFWYFLEAEEPSELCPDVTNVYTFSLFKNTDFKDWEIEAEAPSSCDIARNPANYDSYFHTYYHIQDDTMFWMYSPYVMTYLENSSRNESNPSCLFQPVWEWADTSETMKFSEELQLYKTRLGQTVIDSKNRVRGKGRALQLRYRSESGKDFNVLGWGATVEKNTKP